MEYLKFARKKLTNIRIINLKIKRINIKVIKSRLKFSLKLPKEDSNEYNFELV